MRYEQPKKRNTHSTNIDDDDEVRRLKYRAKTKKKELQQTIFDVLSPSKDKHKHTNYTRLNAANKYSMYKRIIYSNSTAALKKKLERERKKKIKIQKKHSMKEEKYKTN